MLHADCARQATCWTMMYTMRWRYVDCCSVLGSIQDILGDPICNSVHKHPVTHPTPVNFTHVTQRLQGVLLAGCVVDQHVLLHVDCHILTCSNTTFHSHTRPDGHTYLLTCPMPTTCLLWIQWQCISFNSSLLSAARHSSTAVQEKATSNICSDSSVYVQSPLPPHNTQNMAAS